MPAMALSRVAARVVESGPDGENLAAGAWQRLEALPDPRSPQGRIYPLACLIAIALCAFTAAGNDRFTAVGQWIKRAGQADLARLHAPWDPIAGRYRAPDEKTIRVVLDRLDPRALTRALLGPRPRRAPRRAAPASVRGYRARRAAQRARTLARARLRAVAVDGKTSRGARRADGTRVHLLGVAEHGGHLLDHLEVDVKHNETSHFTELLEPLDLAGAVVTFDALHTVRANLDWLAREKKGALHRGGQAEPAAAARPGQGPALAAGTGRQRHPRGRARPHRDPHREGRPRQRPGFPACPPGHQDHPLAQGHRHRQDLPRDRLRRHQPDQRCTPPYRTWPGWSASTGPSRIARQTAPMGSQRADQGSIIGREGLLRLVEVVERLRARECGRDVSSWTREGAAAPNPGAGDGSAVGGPAGGQPAGGGALARGDRGQGGACGESGIGPGSARRCGR